MEFVSGVVVLVVAVAAFLAVLVVLGLTAGELRTSWVGRARGLLAGAGAVLVLVSFGRASALVQALSVLVLLLAILAVALAFAIPPPLSRWAVEERSGAEPSWWPAFERAFARYASSPAGDPLRAATTRHAPHALVKQSKDRS